MTLSARDLTSAPAWADLAARSATGSMEAEEVRRSDVVRFPCMDAGPSASALLRLAQEAARASGAA